MATEKAITFDRLREVADLWTETDYPSFMDALFGVMEHAADDPGVVEVTVSSSPYPRDVVTVGMLRDRLAGTDDNVIVTIYDDAPRDWYRHVALPIQVPSDADDAPATVILSMGRDFDTRETTPWRDDYNNATSANGCEFCRDSFGVEMEHQHHPDGTVSIRERAHEVVSVNIPGEFFAHYDMDTGEIVRMMFVPSESDAGYFGRTTEVAHGVGVHSNDELSPDAAGLEVVDVDGPFWRAMQHALSNTRTVFASMDPDDDTTVEILAVPIDWEEE